MNSVNAINSIYSQRITVYWFIGNAPLDISQARKVANELYQQARVILVAIDGGIQVATTLGYTIDFHLGDMDSSPSMKTKIALHTETLSDQNHTDFEKALQWLEWQVPANEPCYVCAMGFSGGRVDHMVAVWASLAQALAPDRRQSRPLLRLVLIDNDQVTCACYGLKNLPVMPQMRIGIIALETMRFTSSQGLYWPLAAMTLSPTGQVSVANRAIDQWLTIEPADPNQCYLLTAPPAMWWQWLIH